MFCVLFDPSPFCVLGLMGDWRLAPPTTKHMNVKDCSNGLLILLFLSFIPHYGKQVVVVLGMSLPETPKTKTTAVVSSQPQQTVSVVKHSFASRRRAFGHAVIRSAAALIIMTHAFENVSILPAIAATTTTTTTPGILEEDDDDDKGLKIQHIPTQFLAALGDPKANSGMGANDWGIWTVDPGPRGVRLSDFSKQLQQQSTATTGRIGPYGWKFNTNDWWLEEHGLIMESPDFPVPSGRYVVTGGRDKTSILIIDETTGYWKLEDDDVSLYDVTHLPCRSARYSRKDTTTGVGSGSTTCTPTRAKASQFPVRPGAAMPRVDGCDKQDYAVVFVVGKVVGQPSTPQHQKQPTTIGYDQDSL